MAAREGEDVEPSSFVSRGLYGDYLGQLLDELRGTVGPDALRLVVGEVVGIDAAGPAPSLRLGDGRRIEADRIVLAVGPPPAGDPIAVPDGPARDRYIRDPWIDGALDAARGARSVLIVGSGLTMVDVALTLGASPDPPRLHVISRSGLVPRRHRPGLTRIEEFEIPLERGELQPVVGAALARVAQVEQEGGDWRDVIDSMRPQVPEIWRALKLGEKQRFLRDLQRYWDVHRFRMAPAVADRFDQLRESGRIRITAGSVDSVEAADGRVVASLRSARRPVMQRIDVDRVINCTGPGSALGPGAPELLAGLAKAGTGRSDELGIGLDVGADGALVDRDGTVSENIFAIGALRKGSVWESIGVTEIRDHAAALASHLLAPVSSFS